MKSESEEVENKESLSEKEEGGETLVAFANKGGGELYFGIKNSGEVRGLAVTEKTLRDLGQLYVDNTEPKLLPKIEEIQVGGKKVVKISVEKSTTPYHTYKKKPFIRVGTETRQMPQEEYQKRLLQFKDLNQDFSSRLVNGARLEDLSTTAINELRSLLKKSGRYKVDIDKLSDHQLLKNLQLVRDGKITVAALVLLGEEDSIKREMPYAEIRYSYRVSEGEMRAQDIEIYCGGYFLFYNKIWGKINSRNLTLPVQSGLFLREVKAFGEESIREALNNTIIHRDYSLPESIFVSQYQTKIEFKSPGGFVDGVTKENILDESKTRNKLIADTLFKAELVEHLGSGVNLMFKNQLSSGKLPPSYAKTTHKYVFLELDGKIKDVEFAKYVFKVAEEKGKDLNDKELIFLNQIKENRKTKSGSITENLLSLGLIERIGYGKYILSKAYYDDMERAGEYTRNRGLSKEEHKMLILKHLKNYPKGYKRDLESALSSVPWPRIYRMLIELRDEGEVEFVGNRRSHSGPKAGYWTLKRKRV